MLALLHDIFHRHSVVSDGTMQYRRLVWWRKCENGAGNRIWEVRHRTVVRGCQCFLTRWHEIFGYFDFFVIFAALQVVLSVVKSSCLDSCSLCGQCQCDGSACKKMLSVLVCLSGKKGTKFSLSIHSCIWIVSCRIDTGQQSFSLSTWQFKS